MALLSLTTPQSLQLSLSNVSKTVESNKLNQTQFSKFQENAKNHQVWYNYSHFQQISSLCQKGRIREAVDLFTEMELRDLQTGPEIYGELLQGCVYERALSMGQQIHARIIKNGEFLAANEFIETKLVILYSKCNLYKESNLLFHMANIKNVFSWAAIVGLNCRIGFPQESLLGFCEMLESGFLPDNFVLPNALKACGSLHWVKFGKGVHGFVEKIGYGGCVFVASSLVDMYGKCGVLEDARKVFDEMLYKNSVTWNSMIVAYVQNGLNDEAMKLFHNMKMTNVKFTRVTVSSFLSASANVGAIDEGKQGHALAIVCGLELDTILGSSIINFYSKVGLMEEAEIIFCGMLEKDVVTWNLIISGYVRIGEVDKALKMCSLMRLENLRFDSVTLATLMSAFADTSDLELGKKAHCYCIRNNLDTDIVVASSIIDMYAKCDRIDCARVVFDSTIKKDLVLWNTMLAAYAELGLSGEALKLYYQMQLESIPPNLISWNSLILGFLKNGQVDEAKDLFMQMQSLGVHPNLITWTTLISGLIANGFGFEAINVFQQMQEAGIKPNDVCIVSVLSACTVMALLHCGKAIHGYLTRQFLSFSIPIETSLVDMYARCGSIDQAKSVFDSIANKEVPIYNAMISSYALHGQPIKALALYRCLKEEGKEPDNITFTNALYACSHSGFVDEGLELFVDMVSKHHLQPSTEHYGCVVNLLTKCGDLDKAMRLIATMPYEPDVHIIGSLVAACRVSGETELEEYLSRKLIDLEPNSPGNYVALSNAYAASRRWDEVKNTRQLMKEKGLKKSPGCSWIQIGGVFHVFVAGDKSHPQIENISFTLALLAAEMCFTESLPIT